MEATIPLYYFEELGIWLKGIIHRIYFPKHNISQFILVFYD
jgi:hypothetical protein